MDLKIYPSKLKGVVSVPSSKSLTHRHLICAALSKGKSKIYNPLDCEDTQATISVLESLGAKFKYEENYVIVTGVGIPKNINRELIILESASTFRMLLPILVLFSKQLTIYSSKRLIDRIYTDDLLDLEGIEFQRRKNSVVISGKLIKKHHVLNGAKTTQLISGMLMALPYLDEGTTIELEDIEPTDPYIELTLDVMRLFGVEYKILENRISLLEKQKYITRETYIEGDFSNGAVWLVASIFHHDLKVEGLNLGSLQGDKKILSYLEELGIVFTEKDEKLVYKSGVVIPAALDISDTPDLGPILVIAGVKSRATLILRGTSKLTLKESDRKKAIMEVVNKIGGSVKITSDEIIVHGRDRIIGNSVVPSNNDHRIVMAVAILATIADNPITITNFNVVGKSYPGFFDVFSKLGARFEVL